MIIIKNHIIEYIADQKLIAPGIGFEINEISWNESWKACGDSLFCDIYSFCQLYKAHWIYMLKRQGASGTSIQLQIHFNKVLW